MSSTIDIEAWGREYGSTGVKAWELTLGANDGLLIYFHELSVYELGTLERIREVESKSPGMFDVELSTLKLALLYPALADIPDPAMAALEMHAVISQYGHGPLDDEDLEGESGFAAHQIQDIRNARATAYRIYANPNHSDLYAALAQRMATDNTGVIGVVVPAQLDALLRLSPGRIRDLAAHLEQIHITLRQRDIGDFAGVKDAKRREMLEDVSRRARFNSFDLVDAATKNSSRPDADEIIAAAGTESNETFEIDDDDYVPSGRDSAPRTPVRVDPGKAPPPRPDNHETFDNGGYTSQPVPAAGPTPEPAYQGATKATRGGTNRLMDELRDGVWDLDD